MRPTAWNRLALDICADDDTVAPTLGQQVFSAKADSTAAALATRASFGVPTTPVHAWAAPATA